MHKLCCMCDGLKLLSMQLHLVAVELLALKPLQT